MRLFYLYLFVLLFSSCISNKNLEYIQSKKPFEISSVDDNYILQNGDLLSVQISTTTEQMHDFFNKEATKAIRRWQFKPKVINGIPVEQAGEVTIEFICNA